MLEPEIGAVERERETERERERERERGLGWINALLAVTLCEFRAIPGRIHVFVPPAGERKK